MRASQPRRAFTEDSWQKASSFWTWLRLLDSSLSPVVHGHLLHSTGVAKAERNVLGRWAQNQPDTYVPMMSARSWEKGSLCKNSNHSWRREEWTEKLSRSSFLGLTTASPKRATPQDPETQPFQMQLEALEEEMVDLGAVQEEEVDVPSRKLSGHQACANIKESREQALKELPDGFYVCEDGRYKAKRLHRLGQLLDGSGSGQLRVLVQGAVHASGTRV